MNITYIFLTAILFFAVLILTIRNEKKEEEQIAPADYVIWHGHEFYVLERQDNWLIISRGNMHIHKVNVKDVTLIK